MRRLRVHRSRLLGAILAGSWRRDPAPFRASAGEVSSVLPLLVGSGAAALALRRLAAPRLRLHPALEELRQASRLQALQATIHEQSVARAFTTARARGVELILLKGWAVARLYRETWLRPSGDLDLLVRPRQLLEAEAALRAPDCGILSVVDLNHREFAAFSDEEWEALYARSEVVMLEGVAVRVLGAEDQLRFLCEHLWKHSAYRPVWLCDVAAALESLPSHFDWDLCLGGDRLTFNRVASAVRMAQRLLGAECGALPQGVSSTEPPAWLAAEVLKQWASPCTEHHLPRELMALSLRNPKRLVPALLARWPDPIRAYVSTGTAFDSEVKFPKQLRCYLSAATHFTLCGFSKPRPQAAALMNSPVESC